MAKTAKMKKKKKSKQPRFPEVFAPADEGEQVQTALCGGNHFVRGEERVGGCVKVAAAKVTCPIVGLEQQRRSHEVSVHWLRTVLSHLLIRRHVGRRGCFWEEVAESLLASNLLQSNTLCNRLIRTKLAIIS